LNFIDRISIVLWCMFGEEEIQEGLNLEAEFLL